MERATAEAEQAAKAMKRDLKRAKGLVKETREKLHDASAPAVRSRRRMDAG
jgi:hypothetical protein